MPQLAQPPSTVWVSVEGQGSSRGERTRRVVGEDGAGAVPVHRAARNSPPRRRPLPRPLLRGPGGRRRRAPGDRGARRRGEGGGPQAADRSSEHRMRLFFSFLFREFERPSEGCVRGAVVSGWVRRRRWKLGSSRAGSISCLEMAGPLKFWEGRVPDCRSVSGKRACHVIARHQLLRTDAGDPTSAQRWQLLQEVMDKTFCIITPLTICIQFSGGVTSRHFIPLWHLCKHPCHLHPGLSGTSLSNQRTDPRPCRPRDGASSGNRNLIINAPASPSDLPPIKRQVSRLQTVSYLSHLRCLAAIRQ